MTVILYKKEIWIHRETMGLQYTKERYVDTTRSKIEKFTEETKFVGSLILSSYLLKFWNKKVPAV